MSPLDPVSQQQDFSLGAFRSGALEREPDFAAETILGLLGDDGLPYRRGGSVAKSNAALGVAGLLWVWDGRLPPGQRTVFGSSSDTAVLDANDASPLSLGFVPGSAGPMRPVVAAGWLMIPSTEDPTVWKMYGGARKAPYSTGTITVTHDSTTVTGVGTSWAANADAGMLLDSGGSLPLGAVARVVNNTTLELVRPWDGSTLAIPFYTLRRLGSVSLPWRLSPITAAIANRFVGVSYDDSTLLRFSPVGDPTSFTADDYHQLPPILGLGVLRDVLLVFTTRGVYAISGMAYPLVDPATGEPLQRNELVNQDLIAWGHEGIASWGGSLVIPALDNVYLADNLGAPTPIGDRILDPYLSYVQAGYAPGVAEVFNGHYFLPILNPASSYAWVDTLVCRLKPAHSGNTFAWTQLAGQGAEVAAFAERQTVPPLLLAASRRSTSRVLDDSAFFKPAAAVKNDADATAPSYQLTTIDYPTGNMVSNFVHHVRVMYELTDAASDNPTMAAEVSVDGAAFTSLTGTAAEAALGSKTWNVRAHAKNVRFRFTVTIASASCKIKSVEVFVRHSGKQ